SSDQAHAAPPSTIAAAASPNATNPRRRRPSTRAADSSVALTTFIVPIENQATLGHGPPMCFHCPPARVVGMAARSTSLHWVGLRLCFITPRPNRLAFVGRVFPASALGSTLRRAADAA